MTGDVLDIVQRMYSVLPRGWFAGSSPVTNVVLSAISSAWASVYNLIQCVIGAARITTASGQFLDLISADYFGVALPRKAGEADAAYVIRIKSEIFRPRVTRWALQKSLTDVTGREAQIVEPCRPADTGGYTTGAAAYGQAGAWGNLSLDHAFFVTAYRPQGSGIAQLAGYDTGGSVVYGNLNMVVTAVSDTDIYEAVAAVLPVGTTAWLRIEI